MIQPKSPWPLLKPPVNLYVMAGENGLIWDAGYGTPSDTRYVHRALEQIAAIMVQRRRPHTVRTLMISHAHGDHFAGLNALRRTTGARVLLTRPMAAKIASAATYAAAWEETAEAIRPRISRRRRITGRIIDSMQKTLFGMDWMPDPDEILPPSGTITAGGRIWRYFPLPGHTDDHIALYNAQEGILLAGDHVMRSVTPWLGPPRGSVSAYEKSLSTLLALPRLTRIFSAHGSPITDPRQRLTEALAHSQRRTEKVVSVVVESGKGGCDFFEVIEALYPVSSRVTRISAEGWVLLTLRMLVKEGRIRAKKQHRNWRFYPARSR